MEVAIKSLKALEEAIVSNTKLAKIMDAHGSIAPGVTTKPRLNLTALNEEYGMNSYITLSYNKIEGYENSSAYYLKVGVVTDAVNRDDPARLVLEIVGQLNEIITQENLIFGFGEQFEFGEMEESYFDKHQLTWGYVIIYGVSDSPI